MKTTLYTFGLLCGGAMVGALLHLLWTEDRSDEDFVNGARIAVCYYADELGRPMSKDCHDLFESVIESNLKH